MVDYEIIDIGALTAEQTTEPEASARVLIEKTSAPAETRFMLWSNLWKFLTGDKTIGGNAAGDIMDTNSSQTGTNKRFDLPKINSAATTDVTSEDLDKIHDLQEVVAGDFAAIAGINELSGGLLNVLGGLRADVDDLLEYKDGDLYDALQDINTALAIVPLVYSHEVGIGSGATVHEITEAEIVAALGLTAGTKLGSVVNASYYESGSSKLLPQAIAGIEIYSQITNSVTHLQKIAFDVTELLTYAFHIVVTRV